MKVKDKKGYIIPISQTFYRLCNILTSTGWFLDSTCRDEATDILNHEKKLGAFLVRKTERNNQSHDKVNFSLL